jgi:di/tricarboxylate transporter
MEVFRDEQKLGSEKESEHYSAGDSLLVRGLLEPILKLISTKDLGVYRPLTGSTESEVFLPFAENQTSAEPPKLTEIVVLTPSGLIGRTLRGSRFSEIYDTVVIALKRRGKAFGRPTRIPLHAGDILVVEGPDEALDALAGTKGFLVIRNLVRPEYRTGAILTTLVTLIAVILSVSFGLVPIVTAAVAGCAALILTKCLKLRELYQAIDMSIVFLLAGSLALGAALEKVGITDAIAGLLMGLGDVHPGVIVAAFLLSAIVVSEFLSNSGTVPLLAPIAIAVANQTGINPMALIAALTFGSTAAFAMPIGYQTSLMIYGVGGYRVKDFVRMGVVLDILLAILAILLIPYFWELRR